jgi:DNA-binding MarR family transcriptional regulator
MTNARVLPLQITELTMYLVSLHNISKKVVKRHMDHIPKHQQIEQFVASFYSIFRYMKRSQWSEPNTNGITRTQWTILRNLWQHERCTVGQLAEWLEVRSSTMSQMLDRLELAGLVYREADKQDARTKIIQLTVEGNATYRKLKDARVELLAEPFAHLKDEEQEQLVVLMAKLAGQIGNK